MRFARFDNRFTGSEKWVAVKKSLMEKWVVVKKYLTENGRESNLTKIDRD